MHKRWARPEGFTSLSVRVSQLQRTPPGPPLAPTSHFFVYTQLRFGIALALLRTKKRAAVRRKALKFLKKAQRAKRENRNAKRDRADLRSWVQAANLRSVINTLKSGKL